MVLLRQCWEGKASVFHSIVMSKEELQHHNWVSQRGWSKNMKTDLQLIFVSRWKIAFRLYSTCIGLVLDSARSTWTVERRFTVRNTRSPCCTLLCIDPLPILSKAALLPGVWLSHLNALKQFKAFAQGRAKLGQRLNQNSESWLCMPKSWIQIRTFHLGTTSRAV